MTAAGNMMYLIRCRTLVSKNRGYNYVVYCVLLVIIDRRNIRFKFTYLQWFVMENEKYIMN